MRRGFISCMRSVDGQICSWSVHVLDFRTIMHQVNDPRDVYAISPVSRCMAMHYHHILSRAITELIPPGYTSNPEIKS